MVIIVLWYRPQLKEESMRKVSGMICLLTALCLVFPIPASAQDGQPGPAMDVTGQAMVMVPPNQASIAFAVETSEIRAASALEKNAKITDKVIRALKKAAEGGLDVSTSSFTLQPLYEREKEPGAKTAVTAPRGYRVSTSIIVKTLKLDTVGELIDAAVSSGATRVGSLSFSRSDSAELQKQTAASALENAMENAKALAQAAGLVLKEITHIQFVPNIVQPGGMEMALAEGDAIVPITPGQIVVESYVNVTYELAR